MGVGRLEVYFWAIFSRIPADVRQIKCFYSVTGPGVYVYQNWRCTIKDLPNGFHFKICHFQRQNSYGCRTIRSLFLIVKDDDDDEYCKSCFKSAINGVSSSLWHMLTYIGTPTFMINLLWVLERFEVGKIISLKSQSLGIY